MDRAISEPSSCEFGIGCNGAARLSIQTCGNENNQACIAPLLDRDGKLHCVIALLAFERAHVEAGLGRLNAGKLHRLAALDARENADICDAK